MNILLDINTSIQDTVVGLSTIIYSCLNESISFDDLFELIKKAYANLNIKLSFTSEEVYESLLLLYSLGKIDIDDNGEVFKLWEF